MHIVWHMLASLLYEVWVSSFWLVVSFPLALLKCAFASCNPRLAIISAGSDFYEGTIHHVRHKPVKNSFTYPVRMALIDLDNPPKWWEADSTNFHTAQQARHLAGTDGPVRLLANPRTAGYTENPIAIYYCYSAENHLVKCIAVVQNTPWGATVTFAFRPDGESVPKALHVSPFMDMKNTWHLKASKPGKRLSVLVCVSHPELGDYFLASLQMKLADLQHARSEEAGLSKLLKYGYQPQRAAVLIYWQALKLLWKGAPFHGPPDEIFQDQVSATAVHPRMGNGVAFSWKAAEQFPWNVDQ